jgi:hypothetical protein
MRLITRGAESSWLEPGAVVDGHEVVRSVHAHAAPELRYVARSPDGKPAMVMISLRMFRDRRDRSRFFRLAGALAALDHPAAIRVRAVTEHAHHPVLVSDAYPECTFADLLFHDAPLHPERVVTMLAPVAEVLDRAHAAGLVHRALSADSLLLAGRERLMLDTFGLLASEQDGQWDLLLARDLRYISPEQVRDLPPSPASNVYSLTALAVHALTGEPPFTGDQAAVMYAHLVKQPAAVSSRRPELGERLDAVVSAGMAKQPEVRPASATELVNTLADALEVKRPEPSRRPVPKEPLRLVTRAERPVAPGRSRRLGAAVLAAIVAGSVAAGAVAGMALAPFGDDGSRPRPAVPATWKQVADTRGELRDRLAAADTPMAQADASSALGDLYGRAARMKQPSDFAAAAGDASAAYERLAAAATVNDEPGYQDAARAVESAEGRLSLAASRH